MTRLCPACGAVDWRPLLDLPDRPALSTDLRIVRRPLRKVSCGGCGLAANADLRGAAAISDYEDHYGLNTTGSEEHIYFTPHGPVPRSQAILDWLHPHLPAAPESVLEVGCGQGNLLVRLSEAFPRARSRGTEASRGAAALARARGLDVEQTAVAPHLPQLPEADVIVSFGVLEHVDDPAFFLLALRRACRPGGRAVIAAPVQEDGGYDLFFEDHVWHFTIDHMAAAARRAGWRTVACERGHPVVQGFGLVVCEPATDAAAGAPAGAPAGGAVGHAGPLQAANRDAWLARFAEVDRRLAELGDDPVAVFGAGEMFALLHTYTSLGDRRIVRLIDDVVSRHGSTMRGVPIAGRDWLAAHPDVPVFAAVNPRYHAAVAESLSPLVRRLVFWC